MKLHTDSRRTATTRFSPEGIGCQKQTAPRFCQHPIRWAFTSQAFTRWRHLSTIDKQTCLPLSLLLLHSFFRNQTTITQDSVVFIGYGHAESHGGATHPVAFMNITPDATDEAGFVQIFAVSPNISVIHITVCSNSLYWITCCTRVSEIVIVIVDNVQLQRVNEERDFGCDNE